MTYEKPVVEVVKFDAEGFMTASGALDFFSMSEDQVISALCPSNGNPNGNITCSTIQSQANPGTDCSKSVTVGNFTFVHNGNGYSPKWKEQH